MKTKRGDAANSYIATLIVHGAIAWAGWFNLTAALIGVGALATGGFLYRLGRLSKS